jgi:hypothetical protein
MKLFGGIFLALGVGYTCLIVSDFHEVDEIKTWPTVPGVITKSEHIEKDRFASSDYRISYEYLVKGQTCDSHEFRLWGANKGDFDKYKVGMKVDVHYNPNSPMSAFVETDINQENIPKHLGSNFLVYVLGIALWVTKRAPR